MIYIDSGADAIAKQPACVFSDAYGEIQHWAISTQRDLENQ
jgi:hypothetical protein